MKNALTAVLAVSSALTGCGLRPRGYRFETGAVLPPREANCALEIFTISPKRKYQELGLVRFDQKGKLPASVEEAEKEAHPHACSAGGNALLIAPNLLGRYTKAVILHVDEER